MKKLLVFLLVFISISGILFSSTIQPVYASEIIIQGKAGILVDYYSGEVLVEQNSDEKLQIASMVKLMTIYLTLNELDANTFSLQDKLIASEYASSMGGSQVFIDANSSYTVEEMLKGVIIASANDSSVALAEFISGSEELFVQKMNDTAKQLDMTNTLYANSTGLPAPMQYSTARDTAIILSKLIQNETYHKYSTIWMDELIHPSGRKTELVNTNKLTRYYQGCDSGKTGFTDEAGYCLSASVNRNNMRLIAVVIGAKNAQERFNQVANLFNFGFANYSNEQVLSTTEPILTLPVKRSKTENVSVFASEDFFGLTKKGKKNQWEISTEISNSITAPKNSNEIVGKAIITKNGIVVKEIDLVLHENIDTITFGQGFKKIVNKW